MTSRHTTLTDDNMAFFRARKVTEIRPRKDPVTYFDDADFIRRYRLPKATVEDLARQYEVSGFCSTMCSGSGAGITASQRVSSI